MFESYIENSNIEGIEPSADMAEIARKRGINVIKIGLIEDVELTDDKYDIIYFNGSSSYMEDLSPVYGKCLKALKENGKLILLDVPKESAFGFMYLLGKSLNTYDHEFLEGAMPELPYPLALATSGNPLYTNEEAEEVSEGYKSGGYVAIIAEK